MNIIEHYEKTIGPMGDAYGDKTHTNVLKFIDAPFENVNTYATVGLSHHVFSQKKDVIRLELMITTNANHKDADLVSYLLNTCDYLSLKDIAIKKGEFFKAGCPVVENSDLLFIYATSPGFFDEEISVYKGEPYSEVTIVTLVPINQTEADFIHEYGWNRFEDLLEITEVDLFDMHRPSILEDHINHGNRIP